MKTLYIGGQNYSNKKSGLKWKIYMYLALFLFMAGGALKLAGPMIVENWINHKGLGKDGYAFSIREVGVSLGKGQLNLKDVKVFNPNTSAKLLESPEMTIQFGWSKKVSITAEKVDFILSKDLSSEIERIKAFGADEKADLYLNLIEVRIGKLGIKDQKEDVSRTVLDLKDVDLKVKELSLLAINSKTEFTASSTIEGGGNLNLTGKTKEGAWSIQGSLKSVSSELFSKIAGNKLPFSYDDSRLNATITALSSEGLVSGEIVPELKRVILVDERQGFETQTIPRALSEELTFSLPFTLKENLVVEYLDIFKKLKAYRKFPVAIASSEASPSEKKDMPSQPKSKKSFSFWPFF